jgi:hypothetical protein
MITDAEVERIPGAAVYGADGEKIGKAGAVYRDDQTGRPEWVTVQTGLFGTSESFVPLAQAQFDGDDLRVPYDKSKVKDAPRVDDEGHLDISEEDRLFEYYGVDNAGPAGSAAHDARDDRDYGRTDGYDRDDRDGHGVGAAAAGAGAAGAGLGAAAAHRDDRRDDVRDGYRDDRRDGYRDDRRDDRRDDVRDGFRDDARTGDRYDDRSAARGPIADDRRDGYTGTDTAAARDDRFADGEDVGRRDDRSSSGLGSTPLAAGAGAAAGAAGGYAAGRSSSSSTTGTERKPRLSQWVLVKKEDVIEVPADEAERLAARQDGGTLR